VCVCVCVCVNVCMCLCELAVTCESDQHTHSMKNTDIHTKVNMQREPAYLQGEMACYLVVVVGGGA